MHSTTRYIRVPQSHLRADEITNVYEQFDDGWNEGTGGLYAQKLRRSTTYSSDAYVNYAESRNWAQHHSVAHSFNFLRCTSVSPKSYRCATVCFNFCHYDEIFRNPYRQVCFVNCLFGQVSLPTVQLARHHVKQPLNTLVRYFPIVTISWTACFLCELNLHLK